METYFVLEAEVREDTDSREHELGHAGDASEGVLHYHAHDAANTPYASLRIINTLL